MLASLSLQNFRNYKKAEFHFDSRKTIIVGANAVGKSNVMEAAFLLATGKSFRTEKDAQLIRFGEQVGRVKGVASNATSAAKQHSDDESGDTLEVMIARQPGKLLQKKYLLNGVSKRRADFAGVLPAVLFTPADLDIVFGHPGSRRRFLDDVLEQVDSSYRLALSMYTKALRQRNALIEQVQATGVRDQKRFAYWDELLITNGTAIAQKREALINYINAEKKELFPFTLVYDKSLMSEERLLQYQHAELGAGVTLVGPQRDDIIIQAFHDASQELEDVKYFSSRGQQRLVTLELKLSQISYIKAHTDSNPLLLLDDIFSELDSEHISHILRKTYDNQTIITTTHKEFLTGSLEQAHVIELGGS